MKLFSRTWHNIIWQEWLYTEDEQYAAQLFELVTNHPPTAWPMILATIGKAVELGLLIGIFLWVLLIRAGGKGLTGQDFSEYNPLLYIFAGGLPVSLGFILLTWFALAKRYHWASLFAGIRAGLIIGSLWSFFHPISGLVAGLTTALAWMTIWFKPKTFENLVLTLSTLILITGTILVPISFEIGLGATAGSIILLLTASFTPLIVLFIIGYTSVKILRSTRWKKRFDHFWANLRNFPIDNGAIMSLGEYLFRFNSWPRLLWSEPSMAEVEAALLEGAVAQSRQAQEWPGLLRRLGKQRQQPSSLNKLLTNLQGGGWKARFIARYMLVAAGGEAVAPLRQFLLQHKSGPIVVRLLKNIALESRQRWANRVGELICPSCLAHCQEHLLPSLPHQLGEIYYGCRICRQSRDFWSCPQGVVAVLDNQWMEKVSYQNGLLRVNALSHSSRFDFDRVEIIQATDQEVERFAIQVSNDTDPFRQPRYKEAICTIAAACALSENTLRILRHLFNSVEVIPSEAKLAAIGQEMTHTVREKFLSNNEENFSPRLSQDNGID